MSIEFIHKEYEEDINLLIKEKDFILEKKLLQCCSQFENNGSLTKPAHNDKLRHYLILFRKIRPLWKNC